MDVSRLAIFGPLSSLTLGQREFFQESHHPCRLHIDADEQVYPRLSRRPRFAGSGLRRTDDFASVFSDAAAAAALEKRQGFGKLSIIPAQTL